jgi:hypothetical protein
MNDTDWTRFCSGTLKVFETKWTKKLEEYLPEDHLPPHSSEEDESVPSAEAPGNKRFNVISGGRRDKRSSRYQSEASQEENEE